VFHKVDQHRNRTDAVAKYGLVYNLIAAGIC